MDVKVVQVHHTYSYIPTTSNCIKHERAALRKPFSNILLAPIHILICNNFWHRTCTHFLHVFHNGLKLNTVNTQPHKFALI